LIAATKLQYPVQTVLVSWSHPARHSTAKRSGPLEDQKLKFNDEIKNIQFSVAVVRGFEGSYGSGGHM
jgi:hypothetical protein